MAVTNKEIKDLLLAQNRKLDVFTERVIRLEQWAESHTDNCHVHLEKDITEIKSRHGKDINGLRKGQETNAAKIWAVSKEVVQIATLLGLVTKLAGLW